MKYSMNIENDLEMCPSGRMMGVIDKSFKSRCLGKHKNMDIEEAKEQVRDA